MEASFGNFPREGVLETLVAQLVFAKEKPSMLADMIFCPSKLSSSTAFNYSRGPFAYAQGLVERILAQVHALTPSFKHMAQKSDEFEEATRALSPFKNGKVQERFPNEGYCLLRLQTQFVETYAPRVCRTNPTYLPFFGGRGFGAKKPAKGSSRSPSGIHSKISQHSWEPDEQDFNEETSSFHDKRSDDSGADCSEEEDLICLKQRFSTDRPDIRQCGGER